MNTFIHTPRIPFIAAAAFILLFSGCVLYNGISNPSPAIAGFPAYRTYGWMTYGGDSCDRVPNSLMIGEVAEAAIEREFEQRGYTLEPDYPDLLLRITVCHKKQQIPSYYPYPWSHVFQVPPMPTTGIFCDPGPAGLPLPLAIENPDDYLESSIRLFVYDRVQSELLWTATATQEIHYLADRIETTYVTAHVLMKKFPGRAIPAKIAGR